MKLIIALMLFTSVAFAKPLGMFNVVPGTNPAYTQAFTAGWVNVGLPLDMTNYDNMAIAVKYIANDSTGMQVRIVCSLDSINTVQYELPIIVASSPTLTVTSEGYTLPNTAQNSFLNMNLGISNLCPYIQPQMKATVAGATPGVISVLKAYVSRLANQ